MSAPQPSARSPLLRTLSLGGLAVLLLAAGVLAGALLYARTARPPREGTVQLAGLRAPVEVGRDSLGVPHIFAESEADLLFAQGYVHAQDRLWQMELLRRAGEGRLSELFGERTLEADRFLRVLGLARAAERDALGADAASAARMAAYAAGVNAWLSTRRGALPPEFLVLRFTPEPWEGRHSLLIGRMMALDLSLYRSSVELTRAVRQLDSIRAAAIAPVYPDWGPTILASRVPPVPAVAAALLDGASIARASNAWVVGGQRTRSGKPILANDMHLALRAPSLWYLVVLHAESLAVAGVSLPGVPYVVAGHNRALAWGFTNAMVDDADLFSERLHPRDSARYLTPSGDLPFEYVQDSIRVRGRARPVPFRYRLTRHGPVMSDVEPDLGTSPVSLRWASHDSSASLDAIRALNYAADWESFRQAVARFDDPHQNVVFADTSGAYGYAMGGRVPIRGEDGRPPPTLPVPGWTGEWDWRGYYGDELHPEVLNPPSGFVVTANNRQVAGPFGDRISAEWETPFRAHRIRELVAAGQDLTVERVHAMQLDVRDAHAERYRDRAIAAAEAGGFTAAAAELRRWNLEASLDSHAAALYYAWFNRLRAELAARLYGDTAGYLPRRIADQALERRNLPWPAADTGATSFAAASTTAFRSAAALVEGRTWGSVHAVSIEHALGGVPWLERLLGFNIARAPVGGSETTVNVMHPAGRSWPGTGVYGASQRHVVDLGALDTSGGFILPTGQSGLPFEDHYRDQFERWRRGGLWLLPLERAAAEARTVHRLRLEPD